MVENRSAAARARNLVECYRRLVLVRPDDDPAHLSARQETVIEISELWAVPASWVRRQLNDALWVDQHFGYLAELAAAGRIDPYRVGLIAETARHGLDTDAEYGALAERLERFLVRHLRPDGGIVACSHKQLRNKLAYEVRVLRAADAEARFHRAHGARDVRTVDGPDGISWLTIAGTTDQIQVAAHRLTLTARALRADGDPRTVDQLRADLAVDLLVNGMTTQAPVPSFARPVINLTVPVQTVMGLADHPGVLSGGQVVPAALARTIAQRPGSTWHRMLTDPAGESVGLSTTRYPPTRAIWEDVVGSRTTCFRPGCDRASVTCDLDHRIAWPTGATSPTNLWPACRTDHRAKHSPGFSIEQTPEGGFALRTAAGFSHPITSTEHPTSEEWLDLPDRIQLSATEIADALAQVHARGERARRDRPDLTWEHALDFGLLYDAVA